jgi:hypothetical protein
LHTVVDPFEQATHMRWMIGDAKLLFEQRCHSVGGPDFSSKPMGLCSLREQGWKPL